MSLCLQQQQQQQQRLPPLVLTWAGSAAADLGARHTLGLPLRRLRRATQWGALPAALAPPAQQQQGQGQLQQQALLLVATARGCCRPDVGLWQLV